jgi:hypothetical protein
MERILPAASAATAAGPTASFDAHGFTTPDSGSAA